MKIRLCALLAPQLLFATVALAADPPPSIDFNRDIRPILYNKCLICHGPDEAQRSSELRLDIRASAIAPLASGDTAIVPGAPEASALIGRIRSQDEFTRMPPADSNKSLTPTEITLLEQWIAAGAPYAAHWAYVAPTRPTIPEVANAAWCRNPIDRFVIARLEREGITPQHDADPHTLARRVALDLTGLPPTTDAPSTSPGDYERLVDRLLADPRYGEKRARKWLDLARYADSAGYADDPPRTIWAFRDYVIRSFNANKPFDEFTIEQLAGDLIPNATTEQLIATAFHRNTMTNSEGGTIDEEFRNVAVVDRVNTTMEVWMATTMACAQCHTHKYDPLTQTEYFELFAFFNNSADVDHKDERPVIPVFSQAQIERKAALENELRQVTAQLASLPFEPVPATKPAGKPIPPTPWGQLWNRRRALTAQLSSIQPQTTVPVMQALAGDAQRKTHLQYRGSYLDLGELVSPSVPEVFPPLPQTAPADRLALAHWIVSPENPLTARVLVNRMWESLFGAGLVLTAEDFGTQGELPSHPELLDWLAIELIESNWDQKALWRLMVTSSTYRQSAEVPLEAYQQDPANRLLARGPRFRLPAESIRDQALSAAGLLSDAMYGPPVRPPQPSLGLNAAFGGSTDWQTSTGEDRYRRGLYTSWRRSNPYPSMATFDAPNRQVCTIRRPRTNTPLQALVTLNDPAFVEAAQGLARRIAAQPGTLEQQAAFAFELCLSRAPRPEEIAALTSLYRESLAEFEKVPDQAAAMATDPLGPLPAGANAPSLAAWTVVGNVLLNLDEFLAKP